MRADTAATTRLGTARESAWYAQRMPPKQQQPERELTDKSLAGERGKTDDELAKRAGTVEENADAVVERARHRADDVLARARARADEKLMREGSTADASAAVESERRREDIALGHERARADEELTAERDERRRAMAALLALERAETDSHLLGERDRADDAVKSRDDFLALVSHDIRNLLGGLAMSAASLLSIKGEAGPVVRREAERIQRYTARMNRLVGDLLDLASIEAGRLAVVPSRHDAIELLRETQDVFQPIATTKGISIRTEVKAGTLLARYDHERILQVLANLVGNAIKFTPPGGRVDLAVEPIASEIRFMVSDTGCGIASDERGAIFEKFWQTTRERSSLGIGLYISRCIVEAHGGRIWAESQLGKGSTFYFTLPPASAASPESSPTIARPGLDGTASK